MQDNDTRTLTRPAAEVLQNRNHLFDAEIFLRQLMRDDLYKLETTEVMLLAQTLAKQAEQKLHEVCEWLEKLQSQAEKLEATQ